MESDGKFLIRVIDEQVYKRFEKEGIECLSPPERVALLIWWVRDLVGNGGFHYFYQGTLNVLEVADAFQELGFPEAAEACRQSLTFFPPDVVSKGSEAISAWLVQLFEESDEEDDVLDRVMDFFRPYDNVLWNLDVEGPFGMRVAEYIRAHATDFGEALNTYPKVKRWPNRRAAMS